VRFLTSPPPTIFGDCRLHDAISGSQGAARSSRRRCWILGSKALRLARGGQASAIPEPPGRGLKQRGEGRNMRRTIVAVSMGLGVVVAIRTGRSGSWVRFQKADVLLHVPDSAAVGWWAVRRSETC